MKKTINLLKVARLVIAILMVVNIIIHQVLLTYYDLPRLDLMVTLWMSVFVFLLGLQYHLEKKPGLLAMFLMLFSVMMFVMTVLGFVY